MSSLGNMMREARRARGVSQAALATRAGTSQDAISRIERGVEEPGLARFERLVLCLGLRPRVELTPLVDHAAETRRLAETARMSPQQRLDEALSAQQLVSAIDLAVEPSGG